MNLLFYIASVLAFLATLKVITSTIAIHALLYLIVSLLCISVVLFILGAPFIAALEMMIYAGAILVLFVFVIMMLNVDKDPRQIKSTLLNIKVWIGPTLISLILFSEMGYMLLHQSGILLTTKVIDPAEVGRMLYTKYLLVVELSAFLLTAGIIGAYHLGEKEKLVHHRFLKKENDIA